MSKAIIPNQKEDSSERDYGRKPYMHGTETPDLRFTAVLRGAEGSDSYREMMGRNVMPRTLEPHSSFKKPYMGDEFPEMENFADYRLEIPGIIYPGWQIGDGGNVSPGGECWVVCSVSKDYQGYSCSSDGNTITVKFATHGGINPINTFFISGTASPGGSGGEFIFETGGAALTATFGQNVQAFCPNAPPCEMTMKASCDPAVECTIDWSYTLSDETIVRSGSAHLELSGTVLGGVTLSWTVSGTGFSLAASTTTGLTNTLYADATACGSASVTVTCPGGSASGEVRCTSGQWVPLYNSNCTVDGGAFGYLTGQRDTWDGATYIQTKIEGKKKYVETLDGWRCSSPYPSCCFCEDYGANSVVHRMYLTGGACADVGLLGGDYPCCASDLGTAIGLQGAAAYEWQC